jgi:hypothetical protein
MNSERGSRVGRRYFRLSAHLDLERASLLKCWSELSTAASAGAPREGLELEDGPSACSSIRVTFGSRSSSAAIAGAR